MGKGDAGLDQLIHQWGGGQAAPVPQGVVGGVPSTPTSTVPGLASQRGGSLDDLLHQWGAGQGPASSSQAAPAQSGVGGSSGGIGSFLGKVGHGITGAITGLPGGLFHLGRDVGVTAAHAGENVVNDVAGTHLGPASGWRDHGGLVASQQEITDTLNQRPALRAAVQGFKQTGNEVVHPSRIPQNYGRDPVGSLLNDAANASIVLGPVAEATEGSAAGGAAGKAAQAAHAVATAPIKPFTLAAGKLADIPAVAGAIERAKASSQAADLRSRLFAQPLAQAAGDTTKAFVPLSKLGADEQAAATLNARNELGLIAPTLAKLDPVEQGALLSHLSDLRPGTTPEAMELHLSSLTDGTPERLAEAAAPATDLRTRMQQDALEGHGFTPSGEKLSAAQAGFEPLGKEGLSPADIQNAPARLRPMLIAAADAAQWLSENGHGDIAAEIHPTLGAIKAAGLDAEHVIGGTDTKPTSSAGRRGGIPGPVKNGAQYERLGNNTEYTAHGQMGLALNRVLQTVRNGFAHKLADPATRPIEVQAAGAVDASGAPEGHPLAAAIADQGRVPWDPTKGTGSAAFPKGDGNVAPGDVTRSTLTMPKPLYDALTKQEATIPGGNTFEKVEQAVRKTPLVLSPTYHVRIATSNAALLGLQGDLTANPIELARRIRETARLLKSGEAPRALVRNGLFGDEQALSDARKAAQGGGNAVSNAAALPVRLGQKAGAVIDNFSRTMAYVGEKTKGYSDEEAVTRANKVIGDYSKLSPVERAYIRRIIPIYPWLKQVATVAARVGVDHPAASLFFLHAGQIFDQSQPAGLPAFLRGALPIGGNKFLPTDLANPFAVFTAPPGGFVNPMIKGPLEVATGMNPGKWQQITRPTYGPGGAPQPNHGPLWKNPAEAGYVLGRLNPLSRFVTDQLSQPVERYGTGEPIVSARTGRETATGYPAPLMSLVGIPAAEKGPSAQAAAKTAKTSASADKSAQRAYVRAQRAKHLPPLKRP